MIKIIELIIVAILLSFSFLAGVKYADSVKSHLSWLFENKEEEIELPDLSNENSADVLATPEGATNPESDNSVIDQSKTNENNIISDNVSASETKTENQNNNPKSSGNEPQQKK